MATLKESDFKTYDGAVSVVKVRLFNLIACAPVEMARDEVQRRINAMYPCGTSGGWQFDEEKEKAGEQFAPVECLGDPNFIHYLMWA